MSVKKFTLSKEVEYKNGKVETWYWIKLITVHENGLETAELIDLCNNDEIKANKLLDKAVEGYVSPSKTVIKEVIIEE
jgi:hypothetical protein